jgi:hypothetical protein
MTSFKQFYSRKDFSLWKVAPMCIVALLCVASVASHAQFAASLSGTVEDSTGAIIPGATVLLTNMATQQHFTVKSTGEGSFRFTELPPSKYSLTVTETGFKKSTIDNIDVVADVPRNVDVKLGLGGDTESVTVNGDTIPDLHTNDANIGRTISSEEIEKLPIFGADPYELLRTAPGIAGDGARSGVGQAVYLPNNVGPGGSNSGVYQTENQIQIAANGQRVADNNIMIDGVSVNSLVHGGSAVVTPNQEAVNSIGVVSTSYDAADGRNTGAQIKVTTKSGTNELHGSLFFLYNEPGLDAFNRYGGPIAGSLADRVAIKQRTYAASLGGPIIKNKLFLFGSFQGFGLSNNTISANTYVETAAYRAAVIAGRPNGLSAATLNTYGSAPRIRNIVASDCSLFANQQGTYVPTQVNGMGPVVTQTAQSGPYCNVVSGGLDIGSLTAGGASQLGQYLSVFSTTCTVGPTPSASCPNPGNAAPGTVIPGPATRVGQGLVGGGLDGVADVTQAQLFVPSHSRGNQFNGRLDYEVTPKDLLAGSVFFTKLDNVTSSNTDSRLNGDIPFKPLNSAATLIYIHTFSPAWLNEFRSNGTRFEDDGPKDFGNIDLGIPFTYVQQGIPFGELQFGVQGGATTGAILAQNTIEVSDQVTHIFGSHSLKFGGGYRWEQDNDNLNGGTRPDFDFAGLWNLANDASFFESQTVNAATGLEADTAAHFRSQTMYGYVQHDWKVTPTLSFNAGFRYEIYTPWHRAKGALQFLPVPGSGPGGPLIGLSLQPFKNLYNTDYGHYGPKLAFAWNPKYYDSKVVVRGGFATAYNHLDLSLFENVLQDGPGTFSFGVCCATSTLDFSTPTDGGLIDYVHGTSNSPNSYPANPAFATGIDAAGFPNQIGGGTAQVGLYGVGTKIRNPISYLYSLETETLLPGGLTLTVGYAGSIGRHYARLVNQNFLYPTSYTAAGVTTNTPAGSDFLAETDSNQAYNSLNVQVVKKLSHGLSFNGTYTFSKSLDNITNGDQSDGSANQTDPANNRAEYGPSDNDLRNRFTGTVIYTTPNVHTGHKILNAVVSGYQVNSIITLHSGFAWTPVIGNSFNAIPNASVVSSIRPIAFAPGVTMSSIGRSCSNSAFQNGSNFPNRGAGGTAGGTNYFSQAQPSATVPYIPIIGRNSLTGPCYRDVDFSLAKQVQFEGFGHTANLRFQANMYNAFNLLQLQPIFNEGFGTNITDPNFGKSSGADAGRVIEFLARLRF